MKCELIIEVIAITLMTPAEIQAEAQAALDQENADVTTHAAALQKIVNDLAALPTGNATVTAPTQLSALMPDGTNVSYVLQTAA